MRRTAVVRFGGAAVAAAGTCKPTSGPAVVAQHDYSTGLVRARRRCRDRAGRHNEAEP